MPRYTFVKTNDDGDVDDDMMAATAGISMDVCKRCHERSEWGAAQPTWSMYKAAKKLFSPEYWDNVMEMAADGTPDAHHPDYDGVIEFDGVGYRCGLCNVTLRGRDDSEAHYTQNQ
jgi:hypothetical protein